MNKVIVRKSSKWPTPVLRFYWGYFIRTLVVSLSTAIGVLIGQWGIHRADIAYANRTPLVLNNGAESQIYICILDRRDVYVVVAASHIEMHDNGFSQGPADPEMLQQMTADGRVSMVAEDTPVRWLDSKDDCVEVQITDGPDKGREGWVYDQWIVQQ